MLSASLDGPTADGDPRLCVHKRVSWSARSTEVLGAMGGWGDSILAAWYARMGVDYYAMQTYQRLVGHPPTTGDIFQAAAYGKFGADYYSRRTAELISGRRMSGMDDVLAGASGHFGVNHYGSKVVDAIDARRAALQAPTVPLPLPPGNLHRNAAVATPLPTARPAAPARPATATTARPATTAQPAARSATVTPALPAPVAPTLPATTVSAAQPSAAPGAVRLGDHPAVRAVAEAIVRAEAARAALADAAHPLPAEERHHAADAAYDALRQALGALRREVPMAPFRAGWALRRPLALWFRVTSAWGHGQAPDRLAAASRDALAAWNAAGARLDRAGTARRRWWR